MKKSIVFVSLFAIFGAAGATGYSQPQYPVYNEYQQNNPTAISGAAALAGAAAISGSSSVANGGAGGSSSSMASGGTGGSGGQGGIGGSALATGGTIATDAVKNNVTVQGDTYERPVPPAIAPNIPSVVRSCRLYISLAGSVQSGAGAGGIPIGNDRTCLAPAKLENMNYVEARFPGSFKKAEFVSVACDVEGMDELQTCKNLKEQKK